MVWRTAWCGGQRGVADSGVSVRVCWAGVWLVTVVHGGTVCCLAACVVVGGLGRS